MSKLETTVISGSGSDSGSGDDPVPIYVSGIDTEVLIVW